MFRLCSFHTLHKTPSSAQPHQVPSELPQSIVECDSLDEKYDGLVEKYNSLVNTYNDTLRDLNAWRGAADWQKFMFDTLSETYYQGNEIVKYAVDSLISFAKNDDGRGGHQDFLHDDQSVAIKHTLLMVNASDKSV